MDQILPINPIAYLGNKAIELATQLIELYNNRSIESLTELAYLAYADGIITDMEYSILLEFYGR